MDDMPEEHHLLFTAAPAAKRAGAGAPIRRAWAPAAAPAPAASEGVQVAAPAYLLAGAPASALIGAVTAPFSRKLKQFVDNSDAFAEALNVRREDALFSDRLSESGEGEGALASSMGLDTVAELLKAQQYEQTMEKTMQRASVHGPSGGLKSMAPDWWPMPKSSKEAADRFDVQHTSRKNRAERMFRHLLADPTSSSKEFAFDEALFALSTNKFISPNIQTAESRDEEHKEHVENEVSKKELMKRRQPAQTFNPEKSIWTSRKTWCDAKDLYDTDNVERLKLNLDWSRGLACGLEKFILKNDDDEIGFDGDDDGVPDELQEVFEVLYKHRNTFFRAFDYYASLGGDTIGSISLNEWNQFIVDCSLAEPKSKFCKAADLDRLFIAVDGLSGGKKRDKSLERSEFLQCLVRMAVFKYVQPKIIPDVSQAVDRLLSQDIKPNLDQSVLRHPNEFRSLCYTMDVNSTLRRHESSLRSIFGALARVGRSPAAKTLGPLMTLLEWKTLCKRLLLIDFDMTERHCNMCFVLSRMAVVDGESDRGRLKEAAIPFEGFLECLCRVACLKAMPTAEELQALSTPEAPCTDAGQFFFRSECPALLMAHASDLLLVTYLESLDRPRHFR